MHIYEYVFLGGMFIDIRCPSNKLPTVFFWVLYKPIGDLYKVWWKPQEGIFLQDVFDALLGAQQWLEIEIVKIEKIDAVDEALPCCGLIYPGLHK